MSEIDAKEDSPFKRLQTHKAASGVRFAKLRTPEGRQQFGYRIKFRKDIRIIPNKRFPNEDGTPKDELVGVVEFVQVWNDDEIKVGTVSRLNLSRHAVCESWFEEHFSVKKDGQGRITGYTAEGQVVDIMIQGKVKGSKSSYWAYAILPVEAELCVAGFAGILFEEDAPLFSELDE